MLKATKAAANATSKDQGKTMDKEKVKAKKEKPTETDPTNLIVGKDNTIEESIKKTLLKDLTDEDFIMETPSSAIFTLVVGKYLVFSCL